MRCYHSRRSAIRKDPERAPICFDPADSCVFLIPVFWNSFAAPGPLKKPCKPFAQKWAIMIIFFKSIILITRLTQAYKDRFLKRTSLLWPPKSCVHRYARKSICIAHQRARCNNLALKITCWNTSKHLCIAEYL